MTHPATLIGAFVGLYSSTKSLAKTEPLLPPPPYTSEMTMFEPSGAAVASGARTVEVVAKVAMSAARAVMRVERRDTWGFPW